METNNNIVSTNTTAVYKFVGELSNKSYPTLEAALMSRKGKFPANGKTWEIDQITTNVKHYSIVSENQVSDNQEITKRIIDYFCEHATLNNVKIDDMYPYEGKIFANPKYRNLKYDMYNRLQGFFCCNHYLGWTFERYIEEWEGLKGNLSKGGKEMYEGFITDFLIYKAIQKKFGIKDKDIEFHDEKHGENIWVEFPYRDEIDKKYPGIYEELKRWDYLYMDKDIDGSPLWEKITKQEMLDEYKKVLKEIPISEFEWEYNSGDYKPCNNYKLNVKNREDDTERYQVFGEKGIDVYGVMFRDGDVVITANNYYGRHVNHRTTTKVNVDEKLYEYCTKNLK